MQALTFAPAAVAPAAARRSQQVRCQAAPMQQRSLGATPARVGAAAGQRSVAAHAKGAIKPMEATFTEFKLVDKDFKSDWIALVASADFFFNDVQNESIAENMRERVRYLGEKGEDVEMFFVCEPKWLQEKFPAEAAKCKRPAVALVCPDRTWVTFMRIRLDRVIEVSLPNMTAAEVATSTVEVPKFKIAEDNKWTAPYVPYAYGWWQKFMLDGGKPQQ